MILNVVETGRGTPVALLHGLFGRAANLAKVQLRLAEKHRVLAMDMRNHGASAHARLMTYPDMAEDVLETLRARGALPCAVMGHSMGGKVGMAAALEAPAAISRLIVADIAPVAYESRFRMIAAAMRAIDLSRGISRTDADAALSDVVPDKELRGFLLSNLRTGSDARWRIGLDEIAGSMAAIEGWEAEGTHYGGPTFFIAGARSDYIKPEYRPTIRALFPTARFITLKDAGHWLHTDNPEGFVALLADVLG